MDQILARIESFFAIWFNSFKKHVFKVEVTNSKNDGLSLLEKRIGAVVSSLDLVSKQLERSNSAQSTAYIKQLSEKIGQLIVSIKSTKELNVDRLERSVDDLVRAVKRTEVTGSVSVNNFPKIQKIEGAVDVDQSEILKGLQVLVEAIHDLKIEVSNEVKNNGQIYMGQTGSKSAYKITDGTDNATLTTVSTHKALDVNVVQTTGGGSGGGDATAANQVLQTNLLTTIDGDTDNISTKINTIAGAVTGAKMQVDVSTMPTTTVQATDLDIRNLTSVSDSVEVKQATGTNLHAVIDSGTITTITNSVTVDSELPAAGTLTTGVATPSTTTIGSFEHIRDTSAGNWVFQSSVTAGLNATTGVGAAGVVGQFDDVSPSAVTENRFAPIRMSSRREIYSTIRDAAGNERGLNVDANGALAATVTNATASNLNMTEASAANSLTSLQLIDDIVYTDDTSTHATGTSKGALFMAAATPTDSAVNANDIGAVAMTTDRKLHVSVQDALPAGTNAIGKLSANSGVDIGDVDVTTVGTITPGTAATSLGKAEDAQHTSGDVGVMSLGVRTDSPNTANPGTTADYAAFSTDMVGGIRTALYETDFAVLGTNHVKKYYTNAGAVTDGIVWSPAAGKRWYVTDIFINVSAAATVTLEDDLAGGDSAVWKAELAANSGWSHHFGTPLFSGEDAADLIITTSAGNVYVTCTGYEI